MNREDQINELIAHCKGARTLGDLLEAIDECKRWAKYGVAEKHLKRIREACERQSVKLNKAHEQEIKNLNESVTRGINKIRQPVKRLR